jgi:hypothetical protein
MIIGLVVSMGEIKYVSGPVIVVYMELERLQRPVRSSECWWYSDDTLDIFPIKTVSRHQFSASNKVSPSFWRRNPSF